MNDKTIIRRQHGKDNPYFMMARDLAQNKALSYEAVGMAAYLLSKPDDWQVMIVDLVRESKAGRDKVYRILSELIEVGHLHREQRKSESGRFMPSCYLFTETPHTEKPYTAKPYTAKPDTAKPTLHKIEDTETEKEQKTEPQPAGDDSRPTIFTLYEQNIGLLTPMAADSLKDIAAEFPADWIPEAFKIAVEANARKMNYVRGVLDRWKRDGRGAPNSHAKADPLAGLTIITNDPAVTP